MQQKIIIIEEKSVNNLERMLIFHCENDTKKFFQKTRQNTYAHDYNKLIPSMKTWGWVPQKNYQITIKYLNGDEQIVNG